MQAMAASATMTPRPVPNRSVRPPINGVATTLAQIPAANSSAISGASRPRPASHTGQNGVWMPTTRKLAA
jgi:hypothetical protein